MPQPLVANCKSKDAARVNLRAAIFAGTLWLVGQQLARANEMTPGIDPTLADPGAPPMTEMGGGSYFFAQDLGTMLRFRYNSPSYGQDTEAGNLDIGTMQMFNFDDAAVFFDGQVTLNDPNGVGFNVGVGYRWMTYLPYTSSAGFMQGLSIWADGTSTEADNFFPQVGLSYESLGEMWDLRANGYIPVGEDTQVGDFLSTGEVGFEGNSISTLTQATVDTSFYAGEIEFARRLTRNRDAWAFAGPYFLANEDTDALGYRAGFRGYAYPDLLLQIAVSDDDIFNTNATFSLIWFVGRTRTHFRPACGVPDRFREPVLRNDYVVLAQSTVDSGVPLTDAGGEALRIVHIDSSAAPGGDGTFENPFDMLTDANDAGSLEGDILFVHSNSVFSGQNVILKTDQRLLGEGLDADGEPLVHTVVTFDEGTIDIPESAPGARELPRPQINDAADDAVTLAASGNEVANFDFTGGNSAIFGTGLTGNANLHDLRVTNPNEFAISLLDTTTTTSTITLDDLIYDGGATGGGIELSNFDGTFNASNSELMNGTQEGLFVRNGSDGNITFADTVTFESVDGTTVHVNGFTGVLAVNGDITSDTGRSAEITMVSTAGTTVTFGGVITDTGNGIFIHDNTGGIINFNDNVTLSTDTLTALELASNTGAQVDFGGVLDIDTTTGAGFLATGGGTLTADNPNNTIRTEGGQILQITDMTLSTTGVVLDQIDRTVTAGNIAVHLEDNTGGAITIGTPLDTADDAGTIVGGTTDAIRVANSADVSISGVQIDNTSAVAGVRVVKDTTGTMALDLSNVEINGGSVGVDVAGGAGAGALNMTVEDTNINNATQRGLSVTDVAAGTIRVTDSNVALTGAGAATEGAFFDDNDGATINLSGLNINTAAASTTRGLVVQNGGTLNMTGLTNIINTDNGTGLEIRDMTIGVVDIQSVTVDGVAGPMNAIVLEDLTGGQVAIGPATGANNAGGTLRSTGDTILVTNVEDLVLRRLTATSSTDSALSVTGSGTDPLALVVENSTFTSMGTGDAISMTMTDSLTDADIIVRNVSVTAADGSAFLFRSDDPAIKDIKLLVEDSDFTNNSADTTFDVEAAGGTTLNATITNNTFLNNGAGEQYEIETTDANANINLNMAGNSAAEFRLIEFVGSDFQLDERDTTIAGTRNTGTVTPLPTAADFIEFPGTVPTPTTP